jgi:hypothetical protein
MKSMETCSGEDEAHCEAVMVSYAKPGLFPRQNSQCHCELVMHPHTLRRGRRGMKTEKKRQKM